MISILHTTFHKFLFATGRFIDLLKNSFFTAKKAANMHFSKFMTLTLSRQFCYRWVKHGKPSANTYVKIWLITKYPQSS